MQEIPLTNIWSIDIDKYIIDILKEDSRIIETIWNNIYIWNQNNLKKITSPFISIFTVDDTTDIAWLRIVTIQFWVVANTVELVKNISNIIISIFNRKNFKWIKSFLKISAQDPNISELWLYRQVLRFDFWFLDNKF